MSSPILLIYNITCPKLIIFLQQTFYFILLSLSNHNPSWLVQKPGSHPSGHAVLYPNIQSILEYGPLDLL